MRLLNRKEISADYQYYTNKNQNTNQFTLIPFKNSCTFYFKGPQEMIIFGIIMHQILRIWN